MGVKEPIEVHSWDLTTSEARDLQLRLAARVDARRPLAAYETVAGADVSYDKRASGSMPPWWCCGPGRSRCSTAQESWPKRSSRMFRGS